MVDYSETVEVWDIKVGMHNEYREIYMYQRSRSIFDLLSKVIHISLISNSFCPEATGQTEVNLYIEPSWDKGTQICRNRRDHVTKMAIYDKNF